MRSFSVLQKVRINGRIQELSEPEIAELYKSFPLHARIRCKICKAGEPVDWKTLKEEHDRVLKAYQDGVDLLEQNEHLYIRVGANAVIRIFTKLCIFSTALRICPSDIDFYYSKQNEIADRVLYTKETDGTWTNQHISA